MNNNYSDFINAKDYISPTLLNKTTKDDTTGVWLNKVFHNIYEKLSVTAHQIKTFVTEFRWVNENSIKNNLSDRILELTQKIETGDINEIQNLDSWVKALSEACNALKDRREDVSIYVTEEALLNDLEKKARDLHEKPILSTATKIESLAEEHKIDMAAGQIDEQKAVAEQVILQAQPQVEKDKISEDNHTQEEEDVESDTADSKETQEELIDNTAKDNIPDDEVEDFDFLIEDDALVPENPDNETIEDEAQEAGQEQDENPTLNSETRSDSEQRAATDDNQPAIEEQTNETSEVSEMFDPNQNASKENPILNSENRPDSLIPESQTESDEKIKKQKKYHDIFALKEKASSSPWLVPVAVAVGAIAVQALISFFARPFTTNPDGTCMVISPPNMGASALLEPKELSYQLGLQNPDYRRKFSLDDHKIQPNLLEMKEQYEKKLQEDQKKLQLEMKELKEQYEKKLQEDQKKLQEANEKVEKEKLKVEDAEKNISQLEKENTELREKLANMQSQITEMLKDPSGYTNSIFVDLMRTVMDADNQSIFITKVVNRMVDLSLIHPNGLKNLPVDLMSEIFTKYFSKDFNDAKTQREFLEIYHKMIRQGQARNLIYATPSDNKMHAFRLQDAIKTLDNIHPKNEDTLKSILYNHYNDQLKPFIEKHLDKKLVYSDDTILTDLIIYRFIPQYDFGYAINRLNALYRQPPTEWTINSIERLTRKFVIQAKDKVAAPKANLFPDQDNQCAITKPLTNIDLLFYNHIYQSSGYLIKVGEFRKAFALLSTLDDIDLVDRDKERILDLVSLISLDSLETQSEIFPLLDLIEKKFDLATRSKAINILLKTISDGTSLDAALLHFNSFFGKYLGGDGEVSITKTTKDKDKYLLSKAISEDILKDLIQHASITKCNFESFKNLLTIMKNLNISIEVQDKYRTQLFNTVLNSDLLSKEIGQMLDKLIESNSVIVNKEALKKYILESLKYRPGHFEYLFNIIKYIDVDSEISNLFIDSISKQKISSIEKIKNLILLPSQMVVDPSKFVSSYANMTLKSEDLSSNALKDYLKEAEKLGCSGKELYSQTWQHIVSISGNQLKDICANANRFLSSNKFEFNENEVKKSIESSRISIGSLLTQDSPEEFIEFTQQLKNSKVNRQFLNSITNTVLDKVIEKISLNPKQKEKAYEFFTDNTISYINSLLTSDVDLSQSRKKIETISQRIAENTNLLGDYTLTSANIESPLAKVSLSLQQVKAFDEFLSFEKIWLEPRRNLDDIIAPNYKGLEIVIRDFTELAKSLRNDNEILTKQQAQKAFKLVEDIIDQYDVNADQVKTFLEVVVPITKTYPDLKVPIRKEVMQKYAINGNLEQCRMFSYLLKAVGTPIEQSYYIDELMNAASLLDSVYDLFYENEYAAKTGISTKKQIALELLSDLNLSDPVFDARVEKVSLGLQPTWIEVSFPQSIKIIINKLEKATNLKDPLNATLLKQVQKAIDEGLDSWTNKYSTVGESIAGYLPDVIIQAFEDYLAAYALCENANIRLNPLVLKGDETFTFKGLQSLVKIAHKQLPDDLQKFSAHLNDTIQRLKLAPDEYIPVLHIIKTLGDKLELSKSKEVILNRFAADQTIGSSNKPGLYLEMDKKGFLLSSIGNSLGTEKMDFKPKQYVPMLKLIKKLYGGNGFAMSDRRQRNVVIKKLILDPSINPSEKLKLFKEVHDNDLFIESPYADQTDYADTKKLLEEEFKNLQPATKKDLIDALSLTKNQNTALSILTNWIGNEPPLTKVNFLFEMIKQGQFPDLATLKLIDIHRDLSSIMETYQPGDATSKEKLQNFRDFNKILLEAGIPIGKRNENLNLLIDLAHTVEDSSTLIQISIEIKDGTLNSSEALEKLTKTLNILKLNRHAVPKLHVNVTEILNHLFDMLPTNETITISQKLSFTSMMLKEKIHPEIALQQTLKIVEPYRNLDYSKLENNEKELLEKIDTLENGIIPAINEELRITKRRIEKQKDEKEITRLAEKETKLKDSLNTAQTTFDQHIKEIQKIQNFLQIWNDNDHTLLKMNSTFKEHSISPSNALNFLLEVHKVTLQPKVVEKQIAEIFDPFKERTFNQLSEKILQESKDIELLREGLTPLEREFLKNGILSEVEKELLNKGALPKQQLESLVESYGNGKRPSSTTPFSSQEREQLRKLLIRKNSLFQLDREKSELERKLREETDPTKKTMLNDRLAKKETEREKIKAVILERIKINKFDRKKLALWSELNHILLSAINSAPKEIREGSLKSNEVAKKLTSTLNILKLNLHTAPKQEIAEILNHLFDMLPSDETITISQKLNFPLTMLKEKIHPEIALQQTLKIVEPYRSRNYNDLENNANEMANNIEELQEDIQSLKLELQKTKRKIKNTKNQLELDNLIKNEKTLNGSISKNFTEIQKVNEELQKSQEFLQNWRDNDETLLKINTAIKENKISSSDALNYLVKAHKVTLQPEAVEKQIAEIFNPFKGRAFKQLNEKILQDSKNIEKLREGLTDLEREFLKNGIPTEKVTEKKKIEAEILKKIEINEADREKLALWSELNNILSSAVNSDPVLKESSVLKPIVLAATEAKA